LFPGDSAYDATFPSSQEIPADSCNFFDRISSSVFPSAYENYDSLIYKIYAVDNLGRASDTSAPCTLLIVKQPILKTRDLSGGCLSWYSDVNLTGPFSYCRIWNDSSGYSWTSNIFNTFPPTDKPAEFSACMPDSFLPRLHGIWFYALFIEIGNSKSLKSGYLDVP
jgi:hypothetical protein